jgi:hypothetical protein
MSFGAKRHLRSGRREARTARSSSCHTLSLRTFLPNQHGAFAAAEQPTFPSPKGLLHSILALALVAPTRAPIQQDGAEAAATRWLHQGEDNDEAALFGRGLRLRSRSDAAQFSHKAHAPSVCVSCGTGNFTSDVVRRRHKFIMHGEEWPLVATIDGFNVLKGIYLC